MIMWNRRELKLHAKYHIRNFYWKSVLAGIVALIAGNHDYDISFNSGSVHAARSGDLDYFIGKLLPGWGYSHFSFDISEPMGIIAALLAMTTAMIIGVVVIALAIFFLNPLLVGTKRFFLMASDGDADLKQLGYSFTHNYLNIVKNIFLMDLFIFLWSLLFIIPGIVKAYSYRMIPYLMAEDSNLSFTEAKNLSRQMMDGHKWNTFVLDLSFIPWHILAGITAGIVGVLYVIPYVEYTDVELYRVLRQTIPGPYYNEALAINADYRRNAFNDSEVNFSNTADNVYSSENTYNSENTYRSEDTFASDNTYNTYNTENKSDDNNGF